MVPITVSDRESKYEEDEEEYKPQKILDPKTSKLNNIFGEDNWKLIVNEDPESKEKFPKLLKTKLMKKDLCKLFNGLNIDVMIMDSRKYNKEGYPVYFGKSSDKYYIMFEDNKKSQSFEIPFHLVQNTYISKYFIEI